MYLHIGKDVILNQADIVAIIDLNFSPKNDITKEFLQVAEVEGSLKTVSKEDVPKSCIITTSKVFLSSISSSTLMKRVNTNRLSMVEK